MYKFAILGGMFNPIHNGHIYIASKVLELGIAHKVLFMPSGNHPLKDNQLALDYADRYKLIEKAIVGFDKLEVSSLDSPEYGINYTYNLIQRLFENYSKDDFTFLIGMDNATSFNLWNNHQWLLENVHFTVLSREDSNPSNTQIDSNFNLVEIPLYNVSSTEIREKLELGLSISTLVPQVIEHDLQDYWKKFKLLSHQS
ncbi:MAG: nicotinate (nicotinamide) nucleotide adenylyltransferase [Candidatus Cloacimonetes bacterium 4572_65]|nr:MAG: nicotinate (nicotinamide) nucleotide adenylyltransferase [Candidatus Cloacimonetes bacterium 4572_65]